MSRIHLIAAAGLAGAPLIGTAGPSAAAPPQHVTFSINDSFSFDDCGFVVDVTRSGTLHVTLWRNSAGLVALERDGGSSAHSTYTNADTGKTVSYVNSEASFWDYGSGAVLGSSVKVTLTGMSIRLPVVGPTAGRLVLTGTVVGFDPDGIPFVDVPDQDPSFVAGRQPDLDICAALS